MRELGEGGMARHKAEGEASDRGGKRGRKRGQVTQRKDRGY
jgi:hypothetical protein